MPRSVAVSTTLACVIAVSLAHAADATRSVQRGPDPPLATILGRAAAYADLFAEQFLTVVAEERYVQKVVGLQRTLRSDLVLVRLAGSDEWVSFRDVFEVDGKPVRDRDDRVRRLFIDDPAAAVVTARRIAEESARLSLAPFYRETADPMLPLRFLERGNRARFEFSLHADETIEGLRAARIDYVETQVPTFIQYEGIDTPASGSLWVQADSGRLLKGTLKALLRKGRLVSRLEIDVIFRPSPGLEIFPPAQLHERIETGRIDLVGVATYGNFRKFETGARIVVR